MGTGTFVFLLFRAKRLPKSKAEYSVNDGFAPPAPHKSYDNLVYKDEEEATK